ncbi:DUF1223 domain-containing protein [Muricauda sp. CAU 1633]|uniref:DUF1223 domain-containing protein n=1 Tax=Allomuricauda sp. CAU 1633 TaxID=2816036 RepID=UPI001A8DED0A|nr:DUF1223 domain-containing protein [Muricauda sp. CAU 1633]MBO0323590.1 DUF1223 domain-containing protein [Muricauda sp. CAU 1633]
MFKKIIFLSFAFFAMSLMALYTVKVENDQMAIIDSGSESSFVVLELFTSQGCSSCPPADQLLEKVQKEFPETVFALSYHVDYWDYIGWRDPFAKARHTKKQSSYNRKFGYPNNYTPEIVVNGQEHFVGSDRTTAYAKIRGYAAKKTTNEITVEGVQSSGDKINFEYSTTGDLDHKLLRAVLVIDERTTEVKRGENRNRTLHNSNIVVNESYIDLESQTGSSSITIPALVTPTDDLTLVLLMESENLDITAAAKTPVSN